MTPLKSTKLKYSTIYREFHVQLNLCFKVFEHKLFLNATALFFKFTNTL